MPLPTRPNRLVPSFLRGKKTNKYSKGKGGINKPACQGGYTPFISGKRGGGVSLQEFISFVGRTKRGFHFLFQE